MNDTAAVAPRTRRTLESIGYEIWNMKYRFQDPDGTIYDGYVEDTWQRIARSLATVEKTGLQADRERDFLWALDDFKFLPAGRIISGAGTGRKVTLQNCYVMGTIPDDMSGIFENLREAALTMQQGGGIGYDFSTLRPKGALVKGVGSDASGPLSFMDVWDAMCRTIMSAGSRRGAMMATMHCSHPDIEAFIEAKQDPRRLRMFNVSVLVTDAFMEAVRADGPWKLNFPGHPICDRTVSARGLWDKIMKNTYAYAEPGVIFIDRINNYNNLKYCEKISATNPCLTGDTWVTTATGAQQIKELIGKTIRLALYGQLNWAPKGFFETGMKETKLLVTDEGFEIIATENHMFKTMVGEWKEVAELEPGDELQLSKGREPDSLGEHPEAYLIGYLFGDGWFGHKEKRAGIQVGTKIRPEAKSILLETHLEAYSKPGVWTDMEGRDQGSMRSTELYKSLTIRGVETKTVGNLEKENETFWAAFFAGFLDSDGTIVNTKEKGSYVRLYQSDKQLLQDLQRILLRMGVFSKIYQQRPERHEVELPGGKYDTKAQFCLHISGEDLRAFLRFTKPKLKAQEAEDLLRANKRGWYRKEAKATIKAVLSAGLRMVYDTQVPGMNSFEANGFVSHNCGEQPLPPYGACLLGSVNLTKMVVNPFTPSARLDQGLMQRVTGVAVRMMDNVVDASKYPLERQKEEANQKRRLGLGVTGLADMFLMLGVHYASEEARVLTDIVTSCMTKAAYATSVLLAKEKGPFPAFTKKYCDSQFLQVLPSELQDEIRRTGIRNSHLTSIAPTGTISLFAENVSSGLEPVFDWEYNRKVLQPDGSKKETTISDYAFREFKKLYPLSVLPNCFVTSQELKPEAHVRIQAAAQKWIDSSISKTINCPKEISFEDFQYVYMLAYNTGCKGCTTYRPNDVTGSVLSITKPEEKKAKPKADVPTPRPTKVTGATYKLKWPGIDHAFYITINDIEEDGTKRPFEIFINSKSVIHQEWTAALTRMISAIFRRGGDVKFVSEELMQVASVNGVGAFIDQQYAPSLIGLIGRTIQRHMIDEGLITPEEKVEMEKVATGTGETCPKCLAPTFFHKEGCGTCASCGHSNCG